MHPEIYFSEHVSIKNTKTNSINNEISKQFDDNNERYMVKEQINYAFVNR